MHRELPRPSLLHTHLGFRQPRRSADRRLCPIAVTADKLGLAVHNHLRRVDRVQVKRSGIVALALGKRRRRKRVGPAAVVPVVDMLAQRNYLNARHRRTADVPGQQGIGRRAGRAAFGCEQLYNDRGCGGRLGRLNRRERRAGGKGGSRRNQFQFHCHTSDSAFVRPQ